jgi:hypothetical protein
MKFSLIGLIATIFFISCGNGDAANTETKATIPTVAQDSNYIPPAGVDAKVSASFKAVFDNYLQLKNALATDKGKEAAKAGEAMLASLDGVDTSAMSEVQKASFNDVQEDAREHADHIAKNADKIDHQRSHFKMLSDDMLALAKTFGAGRKLYVAHCPMALNNKGADWLSEFAEIRNPYFGDEMLECGEVKEEIK